MEQKIYNLEGFTEEELIKWNRLMNEIDEIFEKELSLPLYYNNPLIKNDFKF